MRADYSIKSFDIFGSPITLNLDGSKTAEHKTTYGGVASIIIKIFLATIFGFGI
jgi:hypothetical protein